MSNGKCLAVSFSLFIVSLTTPRFLACPHAQRSGTSRSGSGSGGGRSLACFKFRYYFCILILTMNLR